MKPTLFILAIVFSVMSIGCSSVSSTVAVDNNRKPEGSISDGRNYFTSLADFLHQVPGAVSYTHLTLPTIYSV